MAITASRQDTLRLKPKDMLDRISLVKTFDTLPPQNQIIKHRWDILKLKPNLKYIFPEPGIFSYRRLNNLIEMIGSTYELNDFNPGKPS